MRRAVAGLLLVPLLGFPLFAGGLVAADTIAGEGLFLYQLKYEQRLLATQFVGDFGRAMPFAYVAAALLAGAGLGLVRVSGERALPGLMAASGAVLGWLLGATLAGSPLDPSAVALALAGAAYALTLAVPLRWLRGAIAAREAGA